RFQQKKYAEASQVLLAEVQEFPQGELAGAARLLAGECLFEQQKFAEALPLFEKVAADKVEKYHARALYRSGACAGKLGNWPASQVHFDALIKQFPQFEQLADARYGLGLALQKQNQVDQALQIYEQVADKQSGGVSAAMARFMIGEIKFERKQ